jgi:hypothetical protein
MAEKKAENTGNMKTGLRFFSVPNSMQAVLHQPLFTLPNYFNVFTNFNGKFVASRIEVASFFY